MEEATTVITTTLLDVADHHFFLPMSQERIPRVAFEDPRNIDFEFDNHAPSFCRAPASPTQIKSKDRRIKRRTSIFGSLLGSLRKRKEGIREVDAAKRMSIGELMRLPKQENWDSENEGDGAGGIKLTDHSLNRSAAGMFGEENAMMPIENSAYSQTAIDDPFKTPPCTPMAPFMPTTNIGLNETTGDIPGSPDSTSTSYRRRKIQSARLMSRVKSVQILGVEASMAVAEKWRSEGRGQ